ncbi:hypothetical protein EC988_004212, partial [Linderina pennispora]
HRHLLHGLFIFIPASHKDIRWQEQPPFTAIPLDIRLNTKLLAVWMHNNMSVPLEYLCYVSTAFPHLHNICLDMELYSVPSAEQISYQHAIAQTAISTSTLDEGLHLLHSLSFHRLLDSSPSHLFKLIQRCAPYVKHLDIGLVSGNVLARIFFTTKHFHNTKSNRAAVAEQVLFPQLRRLHYSLSSGVAQKYPPVSLCFFPNIEELFCDNFRSADIAVDDRVYMPLHDLFLANPLPNLRALKFNFRADPGRLIIDQDRFPHLETLELFDQAYWHGSSLRSDQAASMLESVLSHPQLTSFEYPAAVSGTVPVGQVECSRIQFLMLKGWTFTVDGLISLVLLHPQLVSLQINVAPGLSAATKAPRHMQHGGHSLRHLWLFSDRSNNQRWDAASVSVLFDLLDNLGSLKHIFLFPRAIEELRLLASVGLPPRFAFGQDAAAIAELCAVAQKVTKAIEGFATE